MMWIITKAEYLDGRLLGIPLDDDFVYLKAWDYGTNVATWDNNQWYALRFDLEREAQAVSQQLTDDGQDNVIVGGHGVEFVRPKQPPP